MRALVGLSSGGHLGHDYMAERVQQINEESARVVVVFREEDADGLRRLLCHGCWHGELTFDLYITASGSGRYAASRVVRHLGQKLGGANRFAKQEIRTLRRCVVSFPSCHNA